jgi:hypothetical protein
MASEIPVPKGKLDNPTVTPDSPAGIRADFMRRWFAVAVSVGFAATVVEISWVSAGTFPSGDEWHQIARLSVAMTATLLSWEGYLLSIAGKPLYDFPRFALDVVLVLVYLVLLISSKHQYYWLWLHALTFGFYLIWDYLTVSDARHRERYATESSAKEFVPTKREVYRGGLRDDTRINPGPIITMFGAAYFLLLPILQLYTALNTYAFALFVFVGLVVYRVDKSFRFEMRKRWALWGSAVGVILLTLVSCRYFAEDVLSGG